LHDERLVEEDILDGIKRIFLQAAEGFDEKGGKKRCKECGLGRRTSQLYGILRALGWAYEDEDDIEQVFNPSDFEVVLPGRLGWV
jgi:hypothetical protein